MTDKPHQPVLRNRFPVRCDACGRRHDEVRKMITSSGSRTIPWSAEEFTLCDECILTFVSVLIYEPADCEWFERALEDIKKRGYLSPKEVEEWSQADFSHGMTPDVKNLVEEQRKAVEERKRVEAEPKPPKEG
jgi:hypothetical protein